MKPLFMTDSVNFYNMDFRLNDEVMTLKVMERGF